jgi:hypothetical protein
VLDYELWARTPNYLFNSNPSFIKAENFPNNLKKEPPASIEEGVAQEVLLQLGRFQEVRLTEVFANREDQLWTLWEAALLNRAVLLMADTPYQASQAALAAVSLTNPIEYAGEVHPYVTVYDSHLLELQEAEENVLLGATNPLFNKLFAKGRIEIMKVSDPKPKKHLRPVRELFVTSNHEHHRLVNESALRKYFYKVNCGLLSVLEEYLDRQTNDLKFFNSKEFLRFVRKREGDDPLEQVMESRKAVLAFWEEFISCRNFLNLLRGRNVVRQLN